MADLPQSPTYQTDGRPATKPNIRLIQTSLLNPHMYFICGVASALYSIGPNYKNLHSTTLATGILGAPDQASRCTEHQQHNNTDCAPFSTYLRPILTAHVQRTLPSKRKSHWYRGRNKNNLINPRKTDFSLAVCTNCKYLLYKNKIKD